jgi:predicted DNA-binding transcriptional regulator YafY
MAYRRPGKPAKKYSQAARLHDVIRLLETRYGMSVLELASECEVDRRTVYRDLDALRDAGYPLVSERGDDGQTLYRFISGFSRLPPITFSLDELMTIYLCRGQLAFLHGTPFADDLDAIFGRIRSSLPPRSVAHLERIAESVAPKFAGERDYSRHKGLLAELRRALLFQFRCTLRYAPARRAAEDYLVDPYTLLFSGSALYLGAYAHNRGGLRLFLVERIEALHVSSERFELPADYHPQDLTGSAFGLVDGEPLPIKVRFGAEVAHLLRGRRWHPTQQIEEAADGSLVLSFRAAGMQEILAWLCAFLPHVEPLDPPELRDAFARLIETAHNKVIASQY